MIQTYIDVEVFRLNGTQEEMMTTKIGRKGIDHGNEEHRDAHGRNMVSGSLEMAECDAVCKEVGLEVWTWPLTPNG